MITKQQKKRIKKILGNHYVAVIQEELNSQEKFNKDGNPYSSSQITNVMNGQPHKVIEDSIFSATQKKIIANEKLKEERDAILKAS
jgi:hypothetical protein